ncbi:MAG: hypothetical protein R2795_05415 [Saprospiraceae bacterium]
MQFLLDEPVYAGNVIGAPAFQFDIIYPDLAMLNGKNALYLDTDKRMRDATHMGRPPRALRKWFREIKELDPIIVYNHQGTILRKYWVFECRGYRSTPLLPLEPIKEE